MDKIQISFNLSSSYEAMSAEQTATQDDIVSAYCQMLFSLSNKLRKTLIFFQMIKSRRKTPWLEEAQARGFFERYNERQSF